MNYYEMSTDPVGTPAVHETLREDLYLSLLAFEGKANTASFNAWVFPLVGWIWWSIPILVLGSLIAIWPQRKSRAVATTSNREDVGTGPGSVRMVSCRRGSHESLVLGSPRVAPGGRAGAGPLPRVRQQPARSALHAQGPVGADLRSPGRQRRSADRAWPRSRASRW